MQFITFMSLDKSYNIHFTSKTQLLFNTKFESFVNEHIEKKTNICYLIDENVWNLHPSKFSNIEKKILIAGNENSKNFNNLEHYLQQLLTLNVDKNYILIGVGGGIVSDIVGFVGSCFKRGLAFGFFPTTVLSGVDAAVGGKNGFNFGEIKNVIGTVSQPSFIGYDLSFLKSLQKEDYYDGFAEIIKYGFIKSPKILELLKSQSFDFENIDNEILQKLFEHCIDIKCDIIQSDPFDEGQRKILNFGHTLGHAIESITHISHGKAVAIGMVFACFVSEKLTPSHSFLTKIKPMLDQYHLPISIEIDPKLVIEKMNHDKKKNNTSIDFITIKEIGTAEIQSLPFAEIEIYLNEFLYAKDH